MWICSVVRCAYVKGETLRKKGTKKKKEKKEKKKKTV
jgi:hypothetical protein